jgi:hypothetical protein
VEGRAARCHVVIGELVSVVTPPKRVGVVEMEVRSDQLLRYRWCGGEGLTVQRDDGGLQETCVGTMEVEATWRRRGKVCC